MSTPECKYSSSRLRLLLDTNVCIDYLHKREPYFKNMRLLMALGCAGEFDLWITSSQITDFIYIMSEGGKPALMPDVLQQLRGLRQFVNVFAVSDVEVDKALLLNWADPEDCILYQCALSMKCDAIITRNAQDFEEQLVRVCNCDEFFDWTSRVRSVEYAFEDF